MTVRPNSVQARDVAHVLHPYTNASLHEKIGPVVITRGEGIYVFDDQGNRYIEGLSGLFCASLGFSEERLVEAAIRQMRKLPFYHSFGHKTNEPSVELAERLIALAPAPMSRVFFANSGSEANDTAVKLTWYYHNAVGKPQKKNDEAVDLAQEVIVRDMTLKAEAVEQRLLHHPPFAHHGVSLRFAAKSESAARHRRQRLLQQNRP